MTKSTQTNEQNAIAGKKKFQRLTRHLESNVICIARYYGKLERGLANGEGAISEYATSCDVSVFR